MAQPRCEHIWEELCPGLSQGQQDTNLCLQFPCHGECRVSVVGTRWLMPVVPSPGAPLEPGAKEPLRLRVLVSEMAVPTLLSG